MRKIRFCGDVWLPEDSNFSFPAWFSQGLVFNLEGPITSLTTGIRGKTCLKSSFTTVARAFEEGLPLAACLANNHIMDFGEGGFEDTRQHLKELGISYFGAGTEADNYHNPLLVDLQGAKVALMGYVCLSTHPVRSSDGSFGVAPVSVTAILKDARLARMKGANRVVACLHWGVEEVSLPKPADIEIVSALLDGGIDIVIGHHSHCQQPVYIGPEGRYAFFGLGNAYFSDFEYHQDGQLFSWVKQRFWNLRTTLVEFEPVSGLVSWRVCRRKKNRITRGGWWLQRSQKIWISLDIGKSYFNRFSMVTRYSFIRLAISRLVARPHWPSLNALKHLIFSLKRPS